MNRYSHYKLNPELVEKFVKNSNRIQLLYTWVKQDVINVKEFESFINIHKEEQEYQTSLDIFS